MRNEYLGLFFDQIKKCMMVEEKEGDTEQEKKDKDFFRELLDGAERRIAKLENEVDKNEFFNFWVGLSQKLEYACEYQTFDGEACVVGIDTDVGIFFGIIHRWMQEVLEKSRNKTTIHSQYIENVFDRTKKSFSNPGSTEHTEWRTMWKDLFNRGLCLLDSLENRTEQEEIGFMGLGRDFADKILKCADPEYNSFICRFDVDYFGFFIDKSRKNTPMSDVLSVKTETVDKKRRRFVKALQTWNIKNHFTIKETKNRDTLIVNAIDGKKFYREIASESVDPLFGLSTRIPKKIYDSCCGKNKSEYSLRRIEKVLGQIKNYEKNKSELIMQYKNLKEIAAEICQLIPVLSFSSKSGFQIKDYETWKKEQEEVREAIITNGTAEVDSDQAELAKLAQDLYDSICERGERIDHEARVFYVKKYINLLERTNRDFDDKFKRDFCFLEEYVPKNKRAEIAKIL